LKKYVYAIIKKKIIKRELYGGSFIKVVRIKAKKNEKYYNREK